MQGRICKYQWKSLTAKRRAYVNDLTTGDATYLLLRFTVPLLIGNLLQQLYNMADSAIVGRVLGANALGAVGAAGNVSVLFFALSSGLASGMGILIAQYFGQKKAEDIKKGIANSIYIALLSGMLMSILSIILAEPILGMMGTPEDCFADAVAYIKIVCGATVIVAGYNMISTIMRALGDSVSPLIFFGVSSIVNIGLDLLFVAVFSMGVSGAALATVIAQFMAMLGSILYGIWKNPYLKIEKEYFNPDRYLCRKCFGLGIPLALQSVLFAVSGVGVQSIVNQYGAVVMAAYTVYGRVEYFLQQPFGCLGVSVSMFASQNAGAGKFEGIRQGVISCVRMAVIYGIIVIVALQVFGRSIVGMFVETEEVIQIGAKGLCIVSWLYAIIGIKYTMNATLNGVADTAFTMWNGLIEVLGRVLFTLVLTRIPGIGLWGIWYASALTCILGAAIGTIRFGKERWKEKVIGGEYNGIYTGN